MITSDITPLKDKLQNHVDSLTSAKADAERVANVLLDGSNLIKQVGSGATARQRQIVMAISSSDGGLLGRFQEYGADERALQRMMAECIGSIDEYIVGRTQAQRDAAVAQTSRAMVLGEQAESLRTMLAEEAPADVKVVRDIDGSAIGALLRRDAECNLPRTAEDE